MTGYSELEWNRSIPGLPPVTSLLVDMLKYQILGMSLLLLLIPSSSRILTFLLLLIRVILFTSLKNSFWFSGLFTRLGVVTFVSASFLITFHLGLYVLKLGLLWISNSIDHTTPSFSPWIMAMQFSGLAIIVSRRFPRVFILVPSLTKIVEI